MMRWVVRADDRRRRVGRIVATTNAGQVAAVAWGAQTTFDVPDVDLVPMVDLSPAFELERRYWQAYGERYEGTRA